MVFQIPPCPKVSIGLELLIQSNHGPNCQIRVQNQSNPVSSCACEPIEMYIFCAGFGYT